ncbi:MAG: ATP-binding protein [Actinomycetota bacterium]
MRRRTASRLAWSLWLAAVGMLAAGFVLSLTVGLGEDVVFIVIFPLLLGAFATVGALVATRRTGNPIGWIFLGVALLWGLSTVATSFAQFAGQGRDVVSWLVRTADWIGSWVFLPGIYVPVTFLFLLFPDGHLPSKRWRPVAWMSAAGIVGIAAVSAFTPGPLEEAVVVRSNPYGIGSPELWGVVRAFAWPLGLLGMLGSVAALVVRFRRSSGDERQQLKWLSYAGLVVVIVFILASIGFGVAGDDPTVALVTQVLIVLALLLIPVTAGIAILLHRLYDIDLVINKTVAYGSLAAFITVVYVGIVVGIGALVGSRGNVFLTILATAIIALAFQPARARARHLANRLVYGKRATPYEVLSRLAHGMGSQYSSDDALPSLARVLGEGTGAARAEVWLRLGSDLRVAATWPGDQEARSALIAPRGGELPAIPGMDRALPVWHEGELLGALAISMPRGESLTPTTDKLLADVASQTGLVLRNVRLIEELRASRQRLVAAQDEERRRLERNIHDGAQQQLVALSVKMRLLKTLARKDPAKAEGLVDQLQADAQGALDDLRDLARGIYPPLLADQGLAAALEAQARKAPVPVEVDRDGVGRYPQEAEAAVYFCVLEALQNVAKYAEASSATVRLGQEDDHLVFTVSDDGRGFDPATTQRGTGLQNMADRLEALGGEVHVESAPGRGTSVTGRIPILTGAASL